LGAFRSPRPFAWSGRGRVDEAIRCRQLRPIMTRRTSETGAFSAPRMLTPRGPSRTLWSLHRTVSTSDAPVVTRRHARIGFRIRPMRCPSKTRPFGLVKEGVNLRARGPLLRPTGEGKPGKSPGAPSVVSRSCKLLHLQSAREETFGSSSRARTVSPSTHPRTASGGATNFLLASALWPPTGLATSR